MLGYMIGLWLFCSTSSVRRPKLLQRRCMLCGRRQTGMSMPTRMVWSWLHN